MSASGSLAPSDFEHRLRRYRYERMEEARAVRVGEKETSASAEIVAAYAGLFTPAQLDALRAAESETSDEGEAERIYRLRLSCEAGLIEREVAALADEVENEILAARLTFRGEDLPLRSAQARLAVLSTYADREELGALAQELSTTFNDRRYELLRRKEALGAEISGDPDAIARHETEKGVSLRELSRVLSAASAELAPSYRALSQTWLERLLGPDRDEIPASSHVAYLRRLSPLEATYTRERCVDVCLATLRDLGLDLEQQGTIRLDLDDRPQKSPRACVIPSDPPDVVHLITRAQGGLHDYGAFLHEAGHALHYAGSDESLPYTFRAISRDHALTEIYSYILEAISREPEWHERYFGLSAEQARENAEAAHFVELLLFRRYEAKLRYELDFWSANGDGAGMADRYSELLTEASGILYPPGNYLADMDDGFYSADYLRAWIRSSQLRDRLRTDFGDGWWHDRRTGDMLRELWGEGTRPASEEIAARLGFDPLDTGPLVRARSA